MAKRRILIEVETDLHEAIELEATKQGKSKAEIIRNCARLFLATVSDTKLGKRKSKAE